MGTGRTLRAVLVSRFVGQRLRSFLSKPRGVDLVVLKELIEAGKLTPVIDRTFPLREAPAAITYVGERSTRARPSSPCEARAAAQITGSGAERSGASTHRMGSSSDEVWCWLESLPD